MLRSSRFHTAPATAALVISLVVGAIEPGLARPQLVKSLTQGFSCLTLGYAGFKAGEKMAAYEAKRLNLPPEQVAKHKQAFQIGMALALCGVGAAVAGTTFSRLSKRGEENRKRELAAALEDAQPRQYTDPDRPTLKGEIAVQPTITDGRKECRTVEDTLVDGTSSDKALVKYCREPGKAWKVEVL